MGALQTRFDELWRGVLDCRRCHEDPRLKEHIDSEIANGGAFLHMQNVGLLPPGTEAPSATYLVVGMEPSARDRTQDEALALQSAGVTNTGPWDLHYSIERWLLRPGDTYAFTDLAKCRCRSRLADGTWRERYENCSIWFREELKVFRPAAIVALGKRALRFLKNSLGADGPSVLFAMHYSPQAVGGRARYLEDHLKDVPHPYEVVPSQEEIAAYIAARTPSLWPEQSPPSIKQTYYDTIPYYAQWFPKLQRRLFSGHQ